MAAVGLVVLSYLLIRRDEALRREAAKEQNRLANYNQLLIESTGDGIYGIDMEGNCTFLNAAGARILSVSRESVIGKRMHTLSHHTKADGSAYPEGESPIYGAAHSGKGVRVDDEIFWRPGERRFRWNTRRIRFGMMGRWKGWWWRFLTLRGGSGRRRS